MDYKEQVKKYLEYCEFRKELDRNSLKAYRIDYIPREVIERLLNYMYEQERIRGTK